MKELVRQYAKAILAVFVAGVLLLAAENCAQRMKEMGGGAIGGCGDVLTSCASSKTFDRLWSGR